MVSFTEMKTILANLGFVLEMAGAFLVLPIIVSFYYNESGATIALFLSAIGFLALGFFLNAMCERRELTYNKSCILIVIVFLLLSIIGAIPYIYLNISQGDFIQNITDSIFESASGYTTTGFTVIGNLSTIPKSIIFYRALTQFIGGIGIVLVLLAFFYPEKKLQEFSRSMGFLKNSKIKRTFLLILGIYCILCILMVLFGYIFGYHDILTLVSFIFSALSTGGFTPMNDITAAVNQIPFNAILLISMFFGASNFFLLAGLVKRRLKEFFRSEISILILFT